MQVLIDIRTNNFILHNYLIPFENNSIMLQKKYKTNTFFIREQIFYEILKFIREDSSIFLSENLIKQEKIKKYI